MLLKVFVVVIILAALILLIKRTLAKEDDNILMDDILFYVMNNNRANTSKMDVICGREYTEEAISREMEDLIDSGYIEANIFNVSGERYKRYTVKKITKKGWEYIDRKGVVYWQKKILETSRQKRQSSHRSS